MPVEYVEEIGAEPEVYLFRDPEILVERNVFVEVGTGASVSKRPRGIPELQRPGHHKSRWVEVSVRNGGVTARGVERRAIYIRPNGLAGDDVWSNITAVG